MQCHPTWFAIEWHWHFLFFTTTTFHSYIEGKYEVEIRDRFVKEVNKSLKLPLTTTSTPLTNLVLSLLRSSVSSVNCRLTKVCWSLPKVWRKYKITIIIHEMTLDLTFSSLHAAAGIVQNLQSLSELWCAAALGAMLSASSWLHQL